MLILLNPLGLYFDLGCQNLREGIKNFRVISLHRGPVTTPASVLTYDKMSLMIVAYYLLRVKCMHI